MLDIGSLLWYNKEKRDKKGIETMYNVEMIFGNEIYVYGSYSDRNKANEIAMWVRETRQVETQVVEKK